MSDTTESRARPGQITVRLPEIVLRRVDELAAEPGTNRSDVIATLVAQALDMPQTSPDRQIDMKLVADAMGRGDVSKQIAAVKTVGARVFEFDPAGALVIWRYAAELTRQQTGDPKAEANELRHTAARAANETVYAEASSVLSQRAFDIDPTDPRAASRLGQELHKAAQRNHDDPALYRQAAEVLRHADVDQYARHFLAWCELFIARDDKNGAAESEAGEQLVRVFKEWAYNGTEKDRGPMVRQLTRLARLYSVDSKIVQDAIDVTSLGPWADKITVTEVQPQ